MTGSDLWRRVRRSLWGPPALLVPTIALGLLPAGNLQSAPLLWMVTLLWPALLILSLVFANSHLFFTSLLTALTWLSYQPGATSRFLPPASLPVTSLFPVALAAMIFVSGRGVFGQAALKAWIVTLLYAFIYLLWAQGPPGFASELQAFLTEDALAPSLPMSLLDSLYLLAALLLGGYALLADRFTDGVSLAYLTAAYLPLHPAFPGAREVAWSLVSLLATGALLFEAYTLAYVDTLTRLPARRAMERYGRELGREYAVAMIDIDHFKQFNDTHGHHVGDQVLRMVAGRLGTISAGGKVFRYGGEEFTILFRHSEEQTILQELETLRKGIGEKPFILRGSSRPPDRKGRKRRGWGQKRQKATVTISIGVALSSPGERRVDEVRKRADEALYKAKKKGRNRVEKG